MVLPFAAAINVDIEKTSKNEVYIKELDNPISFDIEITNNGSTDSFTFYNLIGFDMFPKGSVTIPGNSAKEIQLQIKPLSEIKESGFYTLTYYIKASDGTEQEERLTFKIINLEEAFEVGSGDVDLDSNSIEIYVKNKENFDFGDVSVAFDSAFFETEKSLSLGPNERKTFSVTLNKDDFKKLMAGFYTLKAEISIESKTAKVEGVIEFKEKDLVTTTKKDYGFLINTQIIEKSNEGNTLQESETVIRKNIISRLFTSFSPEPDVVERQGANVYYTWTREIGPGETLTINVKTNWLFPFIVILFIIAIVILVKKYKGTSLVLRKRVSYVKAKGGEFALKVSVLVRAKKYVERVNVIDRLPPLVKIYEKFGSEKPSRVDEKSRKIEWNFEKLEAGEVRALSYIIYSKVGVMGKFALPTATAIFEREGEIHEAESNRAFFVTEPVGKEKDEDMD